MICERGSSAPSPGPSLDAAELPLQLHEFDIDRSDLAANAGSFCQKSQADRP